ncbi:hypothetical protein OC835_000396 [Tilletia horrida]|nr:hypothetical protein OC835_000396 [Tilletia horrida]
MTRTREYIGVDRAVKQRATIVPPHAQLKDLLWPGTAPNSVICVSGYQIKEIAFDSRRALHSSVSGSLRFDFTPCCIAVGNGVVAAGGSRSELAMRPLPTSPAGARSGAGGTSSSSASSRNSWTLKPPLRSTIVNAISIVPSDSTYGQFNTPEVGPSSRRYQPGASSYSRRQTSNYALFDVYGDGEDEDHEEEDEHDEEDEDDEEYADGRGPVLPGVPTFDLDETGSHQASLQLATAAAVQDLLDEEEEDERAREEMAAAYGFQQSWYDSHLPRSYQHHYLQAAAAGSSSSASSSSRTAYGRSELARPSWADPPAHLDGGWPGQKSIRDGAAGGSSSALHYGPREPEPISSSFRLNISTNEKMVRSYRVRTPRVSALPFERYPGLVPIRTAYFSTAINHTSTSPDRRTLVAVGDSNDVFLRRISPSGELQNISTLRDLSFLMAGSGGASYSTSWHPSGLQFAAGSSDGRVHVWDIRSSKPLACLETAEGSAGIAAAAHNGMLFSDEEDTSAVRTVKFSPCGRMLAYAQHMDAFHVVETIAYQNSQRIAAPKLLGGGNSGGGGGGGSPSSRHGGGGGGGGLGGGESGSGMRPFGPPASTGPFAGPDDEEDSYAPEAPPPPTPRVPGDRAWSRPSNSDTRGRFAGGRPRYSQWEDGSGAGSSGYGGAGQGGAFSHARDYGYRSSLRYSALGSSSGTAVDGLSSGSAAVAGLRRGAAPWLPTSTYPSLTGRPTSSTSTAYSASSSTGPSATGTGTGSGGLGSSSLSNYYDHELSRLARRSRAQAMADEQRAARQAFTYRRRSILDGRDWTNLTSSAPPPPIFPDATAGSGPDPYGRGYEASPPPAPSSSSSSSLLHGAGPSASSNSTTTYIPPTYGFASRAADGYDSPIWRNQHPAHGGGAGGGADESFVLPPTPALPPSRLSVPLLRSRSPFSGAEMSPEYLEQIDQQSWSALHNYQRRLSLVILLDRKQQQQRLNAHTQLNTHTQLTGLCWEPDGSALYCATREVVARYPVLDLRLSSSHACLI